jgi:hypothetical protein
LRLPFDHPPSAAVILTDRRAVTAREAAVQELQREERVAAALASALGRG